MTFIDVFLIAVCIFLLPEILSCLVLPFILYSEWRDGKWADEVLDERSKELNELADSDRWPSGE